jgi:mevalonate kinase
MKHIRVSSKTFLIGEYSVLNGGPALVLSHGPAFEIGFESQNSSFHPESPAGVWCQRSGADIHAFSFVDPHNGRGGFGASSAQFLAAWLSVRGRSTHKSIAEILESLLLRDPLGRVSMTENAVAELLRDYRSTLKSPASGADLLAQLLGNVALIDPNRRLWESWSWVFEQFTFSIFRTGQKIQTHVHLQGLDPSSSFALLEKHSRAAIAAFYDLRAQAFAAAINLFREELFSLGLEHPHTTGLVARLRECPEVVAVKGCGAMGADVVLVISKRSTAGKNEVLFHLAATLGLEFVADVDSLHPGLGENENV